MTVTHGESLFQSREGLDAVLSHVSDGVTVQDRTGRLVYANAAALPSIGFETVDELLSAPISEVMARFDLVDEQGAPFPIEKLPGRLALQGRTPPSVVIGYRVRATGEIRWSKVLAQPLLDAEGNVQFVVNTFHDVTDLKHNEEVLRFLIEAGTALSSSLNYEETLAQLARQAVPALADWCVIDLVDEGDELQRIAVWHSDPGKRRIAAELTERYPPDASEQSVTRRVMSSGESLLIPNITDETLEASVAQRGEEYLAILRSLGLRSSITAPLIGRGRAIGALTLVRAESGHRYGEQDRIVAELLARRAALAVENSRLYRKAEEAISARNTFLSMAAHELLTPITVMQGYSQALARLVRQRQAAGPPDAETVEIEKERLLRGVARIEEGTTRLTRLIRDMLDVSRIQQGTLQLVPAPMGLTALVSSVVETMLGQQADGRYPPDIRVRTELPGQDVEGTWDAMRLEQVLFNVLDNALKYSGRDGEVVVRVAAGNGRAEVSVVDSGIGISRDELASIFEPFSRGATVASGIAGFGMGLAVCRTIIEQHGGSISVESDGPGTGTRVTFELPMTPAEPAAG